MKHAVQALSLILASVILLFTLTGCTPVPAKDPAMAEAALREAGYIVVVDRHTVPNGFRALGYDLSVLISASKKMTDKQGETYFEVVCIYYFETEDGASRALGEIGRNADDDKQADETRTNKWVDPRRQGTMVYYGTKPAIKAAK